MMVMVMVMVMVVKTLVNDGRHRLDRHHRGRHIAIAWYQVNDLLAPPGTKRPKKGLRIRRRVLCVRVCVTSPPLQTSSLPFASATSPPACSRGDADAVYSGDEHS